MELSSEYKRILYIYDNSLTPEFGNSPFKERLMKGLEQILEQITLQKNISKELLDKDIDFPAIAKIAEKHGVNPKEVVRIRNSFSGALIQTYKDLIDDINMGYESLNNENRVKGVRIIPGRGFGPVTCRVLYTHLNDLGINMLIPAYTDEELYK